MAPSFFTPSSTPASSTPASSIPTSLRSSTSSLSSTSKRVAFTDHANLSFYDASQPQTLTPRSSKWNIRSSSSRPQRLSLPDVNKEDPRRPMTRPRQHRPSTTTPQAASTRSLPDLVHTSSIRVKSLIPSRRQPSSHPTDDNDNNDDAHDAEDGTAEAKRTWLPVDEPEDLRWLISSATAAAAATNGVSRLCVRRTARDPRFARMWRGEGPWIC